MQDVRDAIDAGEFANFRIRFAAERARGVQSRCKTD